MGVIANRCLGIFIFITFETQLSRFELLLSPPLQAAVGEHFAPVQGGIFTSPEVAQAIAYLEAEGAVAIGQTSWGPTGFCIVQGESRAAELIQALQRDYADTPLSFMAVSARNQSAEVLGC